MAGGKFEFTLKVRKDRLPELKRSLDYLETHEVLVGVPDTKAGRKEATPINNAALAYIHDQGSPKANIPARPFMHPGIMNAKERITNKMSKVAAQVLDDDYTLIDKGLESVGLIASSSIKNKIRTGPFQPLKPATIRARKRKHPSRSNEDVRPLQDTGQLRNSITYVVRKVAKRAVD